MKKVLLGTSAIALASVYSQANAAEWDVEVGGFMTQFVAFASSDVDTVAGEDFDGVDSKQDAEIIFTPSITLDNGIKIGVNVQLEANTDTGDQIDESFLQIKGSFGEILLGSENSAGYKMTVTAPSVAAIGVNSGSATAFIPFSGTAAGANVGDDTFRGTLYATVIENGRNNDAQRITYFTPRFAGFQLGASYARDGAQDNNAQQDLTGVALANIVDFGANYTNSFGGIDIAASGRYGIAFGDAANNPQIWSAGLNIGFAGFTLGGSFAEQNNAGTDDGTAFDVGVSYETGPWSFSFTYFRGENVDDEPGQVGVLGADETLQQFVVGANYALAKGVDLNAFGAYLDFDEDVGDFGGVSDDDIDGFVIGTAIAVSF